MEMFFGVPKRYSRFVWREREPDSYPQLLAEVLATIAHSDDFGIRFANFTSLSQL